MLTYTIIEASYTKALLVMDKNGSLYYASLGNDERELIFALKSDFKKYNKKSKIANLQFRKTISDNIAMEETINLYRNAIENPEQIDINQFKIKLFNHTEFQEKIWNFLMYKTKPSKTTTYGEIAKSLGLTTYSSRAVGNSCVSNKIALVIPCHRVVGSTGALTGYKWGVNIKQEILWREKLGNRTKVNNAE
ncbi:methylated-DNA--protein-cysteine methyltransferase [[Candida] anglica]|uniref:Methylated-DNA--protein-cysteine methyltransferase n=1 Tax=[Candida] anglica TaxID=148631 RepID=A0ABP0EM67_9ASCO